MSCRGGDDDAPFLIYTYDAFPAPLVTLIGDSLFAGDETFEVERFADAGGLLNQLLAESASPRADVVIGLDATQLPDILRSDLLEAYRPDAAPAIESSLIVDDAFRVVPFDYGGITLNYDSDVIDDPPSTWEDLLDPRFENSIILMNPAVSSPGRNFLLLSIYHFGIEDYLNFWESLKPNILTVTGTWYEGYGLFTEGEAPIVLSYETSPAYHREYEGSDRYRSIFLDGNAYVQIEVAGIVRGTKKRRSAEKLIDFILSEEFQSEIPLNQFMYPVIGSVPLPASFDSEQSRTLVRLNTSQVDAGIEEWIEAWEMVMR